MIYMRYLRRWIGIVGFVAILNTISCFINYKYLSDKIYTKQPFEGFYQF